MSNVKKVIAASLATLTLSGGAAVSLVDDASAHSRSRHSNYTNVARLVDRISAGWDTVKTFEVDGTFRAKARGLHVSGNLDATVDQSVPDAPEAQIDGSVLGRSESVTVIDDMFYVKNGDTYNKYTEEQIKAKWAFVPTSFDAVALLQKVEPQIENARYLGRERVNGQSVRHYRFLVDADAIEVAAGTNLSYVNRKTKDFTVDVWLNDKDRQVKNSLDFSYRGLRVQYVGTITKVNQPVDIQAPAA